MPWDDPPVSKVNVTLLFSREQVLAAAEAYMRGLERRLAAGLDVKVTSVLSLFVSRWDVAVKQEAALPLRNRLGIAIAMRIFKAHCEVVIEEFRREGVDDDAPAARLQREGVDAFATSWHALLARIREKCSARASSRQRAGVGERHRFRRRSPGRTQPTVTHVTLVTAKS